MSTRGMQGGAWPFLTWDEWEVVHHSLTSETVDDLDDEARRKVVTKIQTSKDFRQSVPQESAGATNY